MKRIIYTLLFLLVAAVAAQAQHDNLAKGPDIVIKGPIIDNINANSGSLSAIKDLVGSIDNVDRYDGKEDQSVSTQQEMANDGHPFHYDNVWNKDFKEQAPAQIMEVINSAIRFYPNPATTQLQVDLGDSYNISISLVNVIGQQVYRQVGEISSLQIDVSALQPGFYLLQVQLGNESLVKRIEIIR